MLFRKYFSEFLYCFEAKIFLPVMVTKFWLEILSNCTRSSRIGRTRPIMRRCACTHPIVAIMHVPTLHARLPEACRVPRNVAHRFRYDRQFSTRRFMSRTLPARERKSLRRNRLLVDTVNRDAVVCIPINSTRDGRIIEFFSLDTLDKYATRKKL